MKKLITAVQAAAWLYIYGLAGMSDTAVISIVGIAVRVIAALCIIAVLQIIKKPVCRSRRAKACR